MCEPHVACRPFRGIELPPRCSGYHPLPFQSSESGRLTSRLLSTKPFGPFPSLVIFFFFVSPLLSRSSRTGIPDSTRTTLHTANNSRGLPSIRRGNHGPSSPPVAGEPAAGEDSSPWAEEEGSILPEGEEVPEGSRREAAASRKASAEEEGTETWRRIR